MKNIEVLNWRSSLTAIFLFLISLSSCKKPDSDIGLNLQDNLLQTASDTTIAITAEIVRLDSIKTDSLSYNLCGNYLDQYFGRIETGMSFNLELSSNEVDFGEVSELMVDSMILTLSYSGYQYGKLNPQMFSVREVQSEFDKDSTYYSNDFFELGDELLLDPSKLYDIDVNSEVVIGFETLDPLLQLHLSTELGDHFLDNLGTEDGQWNDPETFADFFYGLNVDALTYDGAVVGYDVKDFDSKLTMFYRNTVDEDTLEYVFFIDEESATLTHFENFYTGNLGVLNSEPSFESNDLVYVKAGAGIETKITIPDLGADLTNGEAINKTELVIPVESTDMDRYPEPVSLLLAKKDEEGVIDFLPDETALVNFDSFNNEYRFNISLYMQKVLNGSEENDPLYIIPLSSGISVNRVILKGPAFDISDVTKNMRLEITYTE